MGDFLSAQVEQLKENKKKQEQIKKIGYFLKVLSEYMEICDSPKYIKTELSGLILDQPCRKKFLYPLLYTAVQYRDGMSKNIFI